MANVAEIIVQQLPANDPLRAVLLQRSRAYGSVAGALETCASAIRRDLWSWETGDQAWSELVDAIHAPRAEAERIGAELIRRVRNALHSEVQS